MARTMSLETEISVFSARLLIYSRVEQNRTEQNRAHHIMIFTIYPILGLAANYEHI